MFKEPENIKKIMKGFQPHWFIAGGWAIDLYLGKETRDHSDIEIVVFRKDQLKLQKYLKTWDLEKVVNGKLTQWKEGEILELPIHEIHCNSTNTILNEFEILLNEGSNEEWIYRRDENVCYPLDKFSTPLNNGIKILSPEIVLLYKSKNTKEKDNKDFRSVIDNIEKERRDWLKNAITTSLGEHEWLNRL